jgi:hypothetical protein
LYKKYTSTAGPPALIASKKKVKKPSAGPKFRIIFIAPGLPLPILETSLFFILEKILAKEMHPTRYAMNAIRANCHQF